MDYQEPPLDYECLNIRGLELYTAIMSGERNASGNVSWNYDDRIEFKLDPTDPRYMATRACALELKAKYPLDGLDANRDHDLIVEREKAIVQALVKKIHEEYGDYNIHVSQALQNGGTATSDPSLHNDIARQSTDDPAKLSEFQRDELICRHYAPLTSVLLDEIGVKNFYVAGFMNSYNMVSGPFGMSPALLPASTNQYYLRHAYSVSRLTGNIIEATANSSDGAYVPNIGDTSVMDFTCGRTIVASNSGMTYYAYGTGDNGQHEEVVDTRREQLKHEKQEGLPSYPISANEQESVQDMAARYAKALNEHNKELVEMTLVARAAKSAKATSDTIIVDQDALKRANDFMSGMKPVIDLPDYGLPWLPASQKTNGKAPQK